jgi:UDP-N-acetylmuramoylalanine--D-glutamate ligase
VVQSFDDAVTEAARAAQPGDVVLLAPGCASFDQFGSYTERGERFALLARRAARAGK